jgi:glycosyltransferase involved in cell wall biosynthesis
LDWYTQRGWRIPDRASVIPQLFLGPVDRSHNVQKPVWRLAFFSRLEERKGVKVFADAVERLSSSVTRSPRFEVHFIGAENTIDQRPSRDWLQERTADWLFPTFLHVNAPRDDALGMIQGEGMLLAIASLVENGPFAVAEASMYQVPFVTFGVGGVPEMVDEFEASESGKRLDYISASEVNPKRIKCQFYYSLQNYFFSCMSRFLNYLRLFPLPPLKMQSFHCG